AGHFLDKIGAEPPEVAPSLHAEDLYLACACAAGNAAALAAFDARYLGQVKVFLGRMKPPPALVEEVKQALRVRLLGAPPGGPATHRRIRRARHPVELAARGGDSSRHRHAKGDRRGAPTTRGHERADARSPPRR